MLTSEQVEKMRRMIQENRPVRHIARAIPCSPSRVHQEKRRMRQETKGPAPRSGNPMDGKAAVQAFRDVGRRIELEEGITTMKATAGTAMAKGNLEPAELERVRAFARKCDAALGQIPSLSMAAAGAIVKDLRTESFLLRAKIANRRSLEGRLASLRASEGAVRSELAQRKREVLRVRKDIEMAESTVRAKEEQAADLDQRIAALSERHRAMIHVDQLLAEEERLSQLVGKLGELDAVQKAIRTLLGAKEQLERRVAELRNEVAARESAVNVLAMGEAVGLVKLMPTLATVQLRAIRDGAGNALKMRGEGTPPP